MVKNEDSEKETFADKFERFTFHSTCAAVLASMGIIASCGIHSIVTMKKAQSKADTVPEKYKKEIVLKYDEKLLHNIDSLTNEGMSTAMAIERAHTITWEEAHAQMPNDIDEWSAEDCVEGFEKVQQEDNSQRVRMVGKVTHVSYREEYPDELREEIAQKKQELESLREQNQEQTASLNLSVSRDKTL